MPLKITHPIENKNQGAVLIYVLTLVALLASLLAFTQTENIQDLKRLSLIQQNSDAKYHVYSGLLLVEKMLREDNNAQDGVGDRWYSFQEEQSFPIAGGGEIAIQIKDANSVPNLNQLFSANLRDPIFMQHMENYISKIQRIDTSLLKAIKDWIDPDSQAERFGGAEKSFYISLNPAYLPRDGAAKSLSELTLVEGYKGIMWDNLSTYFNVLPKNEKVNVNTVSRAYLEAMFPQASTSGLNAILRERKKDPYVTLGEFYEDLALKEIENEEDLDVLSHFFSVKLTSTMHGIPYHSVALFEKRDGNIYLRRLNF